MSVIGRTHSLVAKSLQVLEQSDQLMAFFQASSQMLGH